MIIALSLLISIAIAFVLLRFNKRRDHPGIRLVAGVCLFISWLLVVAWLVVQVEAWQISLATPAATDPALPAWSRAVLALLREAAYWLPIGRFALGLLYATPLLLLPLGLALSNRAQATLILLSAAGANLIFFWLQVVVELGLSGSLEMQAVRGVILLVTYSLVCLGLLWQARLLSRPLPQLLLPLITLFLLTAGIPGPQPTPALPPEVTQPARIDLPPAPLHGPPPYQATLSGSVTNGRSCQSLTITPGDGTSHALPCLAETGGRFSLDHTYQTAGTYYARAVMTLNDGQTVHSNSQTVVVAPEPPTDWTAVFIWWSLWLLLVGLAAVGFVICYRRDDRWRRWGLLGIGLLLITAVPPFSYLPDPLGIVWALRGGYVEDSRLPLANRFVLRENGSEQLRPYLNGLLGQTGLDPLHPTEPMTGYSFGHTYAHTWGQADVEVVFHYADASSYRYSVPLSHPRAVWGHFYRGDWRYDGLARLRAEHRPLGDIPLAAEPVLATPERLHTIPTDWYTRYGQLGYARESRLGWSPSGQAAFWLGSIADRTAELWLLPLDGEPQKITGTATDAFWSPVNDTLFYLHYERQERFLGIHESVSTTLYRLPPGERPQRWLTWPTWLQPTAGPSGIWYITEGQLWLLPYDSDTPQAIRPLPRSPNRIPTYVSPDEQWLVGYCGAGEGFYVNLCLLTTEPSEWQQPLPLTDGREAGLGAARPLGDQLASVVAVSWRPDGKMLALAQLGKTGSNVRLLEPTELLLYDLRDTAKPLPQPRRVSVTPSHDAILLVSEPDWPHRERVDPPAGVNILGWLPDGERLLLQTYPAGGRRLILVDGVAETAVDLSQPRWDALFALHPDGETLLLSNGRGSFWRSQLE
jgi:hypothetical protein